MSRSGLQKIFASIMLIVLLGTVVSKDLYHIILPHKAVSAAYIEHLSDPNASICNDQHQADCYLCHFEFSSGNTQINEFKSAYEIQINKVIFPFTGNLHTRTSILNQSLRAPPAVI